MKANITTASAADLMELNAKMIDLTGPEILDVQIDWAKSVVHVNVNGVCVFRACRIQNLNLVQMPHIPGKRTCRPENFERLSPREQWEIDKELGALDDTQNPPTA